MPHRRALLRLFLTGALIACLPGPRQGLAEEALEHYARPYAFTKDWFTKHIPVWEETFKAYQGKPDIRYLEIGVYEGRSFFWMLENVLTHPTASATAVDKFGERIDQRFKDNLALSGVSDKVMIFKGRSEEQLRHLPPRSFDIVYIDGSHAGADVLSDAVRSWLLLKEGGLLVFDDYLLSPGASEEIRPKLAIDSFITAYRSQVEIVFRDYQMILRKKKDKCKSVYPCSMIGPYRYHWSRRTLYAPRGEKAIALSPEERRVIEALARAKDFGAVDITLSDEMRANETFQSLNERLDFGFTGSHH